ncbi:hypothetical protein IFR05_002689 [Cadophora sp. M221]|nr:hypothetical protein IFR05_002689 [Cadophora sp. M221]
MEKAKADEKSEKEGKKKKTNKNKNKTNTSKSWSSKFVSSKIFLASGILGMLFACLLLTNNRFGMFPGSNDLDFAQSNGLSIIETNCPFVYTMPTTTALGNPTLTSVITKETTCSIEPGYFGDFSPLGIEINEDEVAEDNESEDTGSDDEEAAKMSLTKFERVILYVAIPVTITILAKFCDRWY